MKNKFLKSLFNNFGFKLLAFAFACILWLVVYNTDDPVKTEMFSTKVTIENANAISAMDKYYEVTEGSNVTFSVSAKRSVLRNVTDADFTAVADMSTMVMNEDGTAGTVEIKITGGRYENSLNYNGKTKFLKVALEDLLEKQFVISASTSGKVADGYALGDVSVSGSNILKISGPSSIVSQINSAVAIINVDGVSTNVSDTVVPTLFDESGNVLDTAKLSMSTSAVSINASVLSTKYLSLILGSVGTPEEGYEVVNLVAEPDSVRVKGVSSILNGITTLEIPAEVFDVEGLSESYTTTIDISEYLPDNIQLVNNKDGIIAVTVIIEPYEEAEIAVETSRIDVTGLSEELTLEYSEDTVTVKVGAVTSVLNSLYSGNVLLALDATELEAGTHTVPLLLADEAGNYDLLEATVEITLTKIEAEGATVDETDHQNGTTSGNN